MGRRRVVDCYNHNGKNLNCSENALHQCRRCKSCHHYDCENCKNKCACCDADCTKCRISCGIRRANYKV